MYAEPAREHLERRGAEVRTGATATLRVVDGAVAGVDVDGERLQAGCVVSAVPWFALPTLCPDQPAALADVVDRARRTLASPIVTVNLWFDRPVMDKPFIGLPGRAMQWVFDKRLVFGGDASHLSLLSSGAASLLGLTNDELTALAQTELMEAMPEFRSAHVVRATVIREPRATFSLAPRSARQARV